MSEQQWHIADLIDLEFFLGQDDGEDLDILAARDREMYTRFPAAVTGEKTSTSALLLSWLAGRKQAYAETSDETPLPGQIRQELFSLFFWGCLILGLVAGGTIAFSFLSYSGTRPVNVSAYFGIFVAFQIVLLVLLFLLFLYRRMLGRGLDGSFLYKMLRRFFYKLVSGISCRAASRASADTRLKWSGHAGGINQLQKRYGALFIRPFFLLGQVFGVSFNAGVLAATLLKVIGSDVAFGWQTTLQIGSETVHGLVRWISLPWSWFLPTYCCPSLAQVEGSKLVLKDGIYHLATHDLISWWPFLCLSVLFYGLLPRLVLLLAGTIRQHRDLASLVFEHGRYRQLVHRMRTPTVSTSAPAEEQTGQHEEVTTAPQISVKQVDNQPHRATRTSMVGLVPDELFADCSPEALRKQVHVRLGYELASVLPVWTMERSEGEELVELKETMIATGSNDILLLQEAWQPPIQELLSFLRRMREIVGEQPTIIVALIGKPATDTMLTPVLKLNLQIWQQKLTTLGDSGLQLVELVKS
ncbi:MAG: DUF2868 domain-containing protein [Deltaproteobacteria bacterium]|nr:DUF2868 domain-containing protein [Deltaproteobacteria bacterium]